MIEEELLYRPRVREIAMGDEIIAQDEVMGDRITITRRKPKPPDSPYHSCV